jgi:hypothetical protein
MLSAGIPQPGVICVEGIEIISFTIWNDGSITTLIDLPIIISVETGSVILPGLTDQGSRGGYSLGGIGPSGPRFVSILVTGDNNNGNE